MQIANDVRPMGVTSLGGDGGMDPPVAAATPSTGAESVGNEGVKLTLSSGLAEESPTYAKPTSLKTMDDGSGNEPPSSDATRETEGTTLGGTEIQFMTGGDGNDPPPPPADPKPK